MRNGIWFGGLLAPEAFLIATQQATAQQHGWSLEELELKLQFAPSDEELQQAVDESTGFIVHGLAIESAEFDLVDRRIKLASQLSTALPTVNLQWIRKDTAEAGAQPAGGEAAASDQPGEPAGQTQPMVELPLYLNRSRQNLVCSVRMPTFGVPAHAWYQRGVALFAR